ncbi:MAG: VWA domain-containing protein [Bdellovibrionota bacterium]
MTLFLFILTSIHSTLLSAQNQEVQDEINRQRDNSKDAWGNCLTSDTWILSDYSGSMEGYESRVFGAAQEIGNGILRENAKARIGVILFNDSQTLVQGLTNNKDELNDSLADFENVGAEGGTEIYRALLTTEYLQNRTEKSKYAQEQDFRKIIILISDGEDGKSEKSIIMSRHLKNSGWIIYSIFVHKNSVSEEQARDGGYRHLEKISGDFSPESAYVDSVLLDDLSNHFREKFSCM